MRPELQANEWHRVLSSFTASLSRLADLKLDRVEAANGRLLPPPGLQPIRAGRYLEANVPDQVIRTSSPLTVASPLVSKTLSTASLAGALVTPIRSAIRSAMSHLFICFPLANSDLPIPQSLAEAPLRPGICLAQTPSPRDHCVDEFPLCARPLVVATLHSAALTGSNGSSRPAAVPLRRARPDELYHLDARVHIHTPHFRNRDKGAGPSSFLSVNGGVRSGG